MNTQSTLTDDFNPLDYLSPLVASIRTHITHKLTDFAEHLGVPVHWVAEQLLSTAHLFADNIEDSSLLVCIIIWFMLEDKDAIVMMRKQLEKLFGEKAAIIFDKAAGYMETYRGRLQNYYDFNASLAWPEIIGKGDYWVWQNEQFPSEFEFCTPENDVELHEEGHVTVGDIKAFIYESVPPSEREAIFGQAA